ncbi:MAG: glycosyl transferase [Bacteroidales bacterium]|nr:glycosyl transferase [Bacteroidales bacterium]
MIPKKIHYCWLSDDPVPENLNVYMSSWKRLLPEYEFILWNKSRFDINSVSWVKEAYEEKKYAFAADYIRLYSLYTYGGIYLDMDVEVVKSFNPLLNQKYILGYEKKNGIEAGIMGAEKGADWVKECLDYYEGRHFKNPDGSLNTKPLPRILYSILKPNINSMNIFPNEYLTAKSYYTGETAITENTYSIHHFAGSWLGPIEQLSYQIRKKIPFLPEKIKGHIAKVMAIAKIEGLRSAVKEEIKWVKKLFA